MRSFEPAMVEQVDIFIRGLARKHQQQPINVKDRCSYLSFDIIGLLSFGYALNLQTDEQNQFLAEQLAHGTHRMNVYMQIPIIPRYRLQTWINLLFHQEREKTARLIETMIRNRMADDVNAKRDLFSFVADAVDAKDDDGLRLGDLWYEAFFFIIAGMLASLLSLSAICVLSAKCRWRHNSHGPKRHIILFVAEPGVLLKARHGNPHDIPERN